LRAAFGAGSLGRTMKKTCYLSSQYYRLVKRLGRKKALWGRGPFVVGDQSIMFLERDQTTPNSAVIILIAITSSATRLLHPSVQMLGPENQNLEELLKAA